MNSIFQAQELSAAISTHKVYDSEPGPLSRFRELGRTDLFNALQFEKLTTTTSVVCNVLDRDTNQADSHTQCHRH